MIARAKIALIGDYNPKVTAHAAIPKALALAGEALAGVVVGTWIETSDIPADAASVLSGFDALWVVPASPYANTEGALAAIRFAREGRLPFLGTCGGYQHAAIEFARNVLGQTEAGNVETDPQCPMPVISPLECALVEATGRITFNEGSRLESIYGKRTADEGYRCSFGVSRAYLSIFDASDLLFTGFDAEGDPRAYELAGHPFFIGTAYQPERSALRGEAHPIIAEFINSSLARADQAA